MKFDRLVELTRHTDSQIDVGSDRAWLRMLFRYGMVLVWVGVAFGVGFAFEPVFHERFAFTFFVTSALLSAWSGGLKPGLIALVIGFGLADYFFVPPLGSFGKYGKVEWALLVGHAVPALLGIWLFDSVQRTRRRLQVKAQALEQEVARRQEAEQRARAAEAEVRGYAIHLEKAVNERTGELNESIAFLEKYCYSIAHDLRAPLRAITGFVHLLREEIPQSIPNNAQMAADRILTGTQRMDKLISDLLEYGRLSHEPLHLRQIELSRAIAAVLDSFHRKIDAAAAIVETAHSGDTVWADQELLQTAMAHLLANALQFAKAGESPRIRLWSERHDNMTRLWIADEGVGIPLEYQHKIFGLFQTLTAPNEERTGLGLAIVSKVVQRMHGKVGVESRAGQGARFWIELASDSPEARIDRKTARPGPSQESHDRRNEIGEQRVSRRRVITVAPTSQTSRVRFPDIASSTRRLAMRTHASASDISGSKRDKNVRQRFPGCGRWSDTFPARDPHRSHKKSGPDTSAGIERRSAEWVTVRHSARRCQHTDLGICRASRPSGSDRSSNWPGDTQ